MNKPVLFFEDIEEVFEDVKKIIEMQ